MNTMEDLRDIIQRRLRDTVHGKEIDMLHGEPPRIPHMLGITELGEPHEPANENGTLLDPQHEFWRDYHESVNEGIVHRKIETAIRTLKDNGKMETSWPYGEDGDIIYTEVEKPKEPADGVIQTSCPKCSATLHTSPTLSLTSASAYLRVSVDCPECPFGGSYKKRMERE